MVAGLAIGVSAAAGLAGSAISASGSSAAGKEAANAANNAAALQESQFQQTNSNLAPYRSAGNAALPALQAQPGLSAAANQTAYNNAQSTLPTAMTQAQLVQTPGYQFNLSQGLKATQSAAAAQGLGVSGAALKGAATYATGLANNTYTQQLANQNTIYQANSNQFANQLNASNQAYNQLNSNAALGENAAATTGYIGQQAAGQAGANIAGAGQAAAAGTVASSNALASGVANSGNSGLGYLALSNALQNSGSFSDNPLAGAPVGANGLLYGSGT